MVSAVEIVSTLESVIEYAAQHSAIPATRIPAWIKPKRIRR